MRRRQVLAALATGVAGALAGCSDPRASVRLTVVDDAAIADRFAVRAADLPEEHRRIVADAVEADAATDEGTGPPFEPDDPVGYGGRYYELSWTVIDETEASAYGVEIDYDPADATPDGGGIRYADLPDVDRSALAELVPPRRDDPDVRDGYDMGTRAVYTDDELERSVLAPDQEFDLVVHDGAAYRLTVGDREPAIVNTYRYTAEQVAEDAAALAAGVRDRYGFRFAELSAAQRRILDAAREDGYREEEPSRAFRDLVGRLREHGAVDADEYGGEWLVRYDGDDYWLDLRTPGDWRQGTVARETPSEY